MMWFPAYHQLRMQPNKNYLHSLWLGFIWPILSLPEIVFCMLIKPTFSILLRQSILQAPFSILILWVRVILATILLPFVGLAGRLNTENITLEQLKARIFAETLIKMATDSIREDLEALQKAQSVQEQAKQ